MKHLIGVKKVNQFFWAACLSLMSLHALASSPADAKKIVETLSDKVVTTLNEQRATFEASPEKMQAFAVNDIMPYIDTPKMAKYVMARFWRTATKAQQESFVEVFTNALLRSYSVSLLKLKVDQIEVSQPIEEKRGRVLVPTTVTQSDGNVTEVAYRVYFSKKRSKWVLYDVSIEGISMLLNYRKTYGSEFKNKGVDRVISEVRAKNDGFLKTSTLTEE